MIHGVAKRAKVCKGLGRTQRKSRMFPHFRNPKDPFKIVCLISFSYRLDNQNFSAFKMDALMATNTLPRDIRTDIPMIPKIFPDEDRSDNFNFTSFCFKYLGSSAAEESSLGFLKWSQEQKGGLQQGCSHGAGNTLELRGTKFCNDRK